MINLFKSSDAIFIIIKVLTLVFCLPWPLTLIPSIMSLAGTFPDGTPPLHVLFIKMGWLCVALYPFIFIGLIYILEHYVAPRVYILAVVLSLLPSLTSIGVLYWLFGDKAT